MPFDINAARSAGYKDDEIAQFMAKQNANFDVPAAIKAGYSVDEIAGRLSKKEPFRVADIAAEEKGLEEVPGPITNLLTLGIGGTGEAAAAGLPVLGRVAKNIIDTPSNTVSAVKSIPGAVKGAANAVTGGVGRLVDHLSAIKNAGTIDEAKAIALEMENAFKAAPKAQTAAGEQTAEMLSRPAANVDAIKTKLASLPETMVTKEAQLQQSLGRTKQAMQEVEKAKGWNNIDASAPGFQEAIQNPETISKVAKFAEEGLAKGNMNPNLAQLYRKMLQEQTAFEKTSMAGAQLGKVQSRLGEHLGTLDETFGGLRKSFEEINTQLKNLPKEKVALKSATRTQLVQAQSRLKAVQEEAKELMKQAKVADAAELKRISAKGRQLIQKAHQLQTIKKTLWGAATAGAGATIYKAVH